MKIWIIDDSVSNLEVIAKFLKLQGHEVVTTTSGKEGLSLLENEIFDATFLDVDIPEFSGIDIVNALHKSGRIKDQKIIIFTAALVKEKIMYDLIEKGVRIFLKKPMDLSVLMKKMEEMVKSN